MHFINNSLDIIVEMFLDLKKKIDIYIYFLFFPSSPIIHVKIKGGGVHLIFIFIYLNSITTPKKHKKANLPYDSFSLFITSFIYYDKTVQCIGF